MMTVESIEPVPMQERLYRIRFADGTVLKTQDYVILEQGITPGQTLDESTMEQLRLAVGRASAKARALRMIAAAGVSKGELEHRLKQKGEKAADAAEAVAWLEELQLLDDGETAAQLVQSAVRKGYGKARIRQILYQKHIPEEYWEDALSQVPEMDDAVDSFLLRRFRGSEPDEKELKRAMDALLRRGHSWADIRAGLRRYSASLEDRLEEFPHE